MELGVGVLGLREGCSEVGFSDGEYVGSNVVGSAVLGVADGLEVDGTSATSDGE